MKVGGKRYRTVWVEATDPGVVRIIDQRALPFRFVEEALGTVEEVARAIREMHVRGAGCIGATAGYGMYLAVREARKAADFEKAIAEAAATLRATRPTAVNLDWAVGRQFGAIGDAAGPEEKEVAALREAERIADEDAENCRRIGEHGLGVIADLSKRKGGDPVNVLTHCNAGWLAFVDYGSATAPIYAAHDRGIAVHVWVDETRPRNQGARLTAWELGEQGVAHTVIADNTGGHLMQRGEVDLVITGTDRTTSTGDVANKIGTYLKALAAKDNGVPFYVALPSSTFDWESRDGSEIPIEERDAGEVTHVGGIAAGGGPEVEVRLVPEGSAAANYAFDVTPARLITGLITERGLCPASEKGILGLFPERGAGSSH